jgi:YfiH family protein
VLQCEHGSGEPAEEHPLIERRVGRCELLCFERLSQEAPVVHGIFTRRGGFSAAPYASLNLSVSTGDDPATVRRNRELVAAAVKLPLVSARPVHGADVAEVAPDTAAPGEATDLTGWRERLRATTADAMITDRPGFGLFWAYGDCVPILLYDPQHRAIALVHAGWRGTAAAIAARTVAALARRFGSRPSDLLAGIAPAIGKCCYVVSEEVRQRFRANATAWASACFEERDNTDSDMTGPHLYLDLWESNRRQLLAAGLRPSHIELAGICTGSRTDLFFSHRMERGQTGRFGVVIGLANQQ